MQVDHELGMVQLRIELAELRQQLLHAGLSAGWQQPPSIGAVAAVGTGAQVRVCVCDLVMMERWKENRMEGAGLV